MPVLFVPGNHEFDGRDVDQAAIDLRAFCDSLGIRMLHRDSVVIADDQGRRIRFCGTVRWSDFDLFGEAGRAKALARRLVLPARDGRDAPRPAVRRRGRARAGAGVPRLAGAHAAGVAAGALGHARWRSRISRPACAAPIRATGRQPTTASFCNADDDLIPRADLWIHGHLHCRHDYLVPRPGLHASRVVCQARGLEKKGEADGYDPLRLDRGLSARARQAPSLRPSHSRHGATGTAARIGGGDSPGASVL